jgi:uroporphyrinogen III methyltransferase/synthase
MKRKGRIVLGGLGPGDPGLVPVRLLALLGEADCVVTPVPLPEELAGELRPGAEVLAGDEDLVVARAKAGDTVVWLVPGDPVTSEEVAVAWPVLVRSRLPLELVPSVSAAAGAAAYAGVPLGLDVAVVGTEDLSWALDAPTLVVPVAEGEADAVAAALLDLELDPDTPVLVVSQPATARQQTIATALAGVPAVPGPAVVIVGEAAGERLVPWWESRPLFGLSVLVPRSRQQAGLLSAELRALGAEPVEVPTIAIEPPRNPATLDKAVAGIVSGRYAWVAFTSANAVTALRERIELVGLDARVFSGTKIAAVGTATAESLREFGLRPDLVPSGSMTAAALGREWPPRDDRLDPLDRILLPRADIATETLVSAVKAKGWLVDEVTAYRTVRAAPPQEEVRAAVRGGGIDAVVFTSSSTVRNFVALCGLPHPSTVVAVIGPQTAATARELGLRVDVESRQSTVTGVAQALAAHLARQVPPKAGKGSR